MNSPNRTATLFALASVALCVSTASADLRGRYLTQDTSHGFDAYYDTTQNVTWLADALYGGRMDWNTADNWVATLRLGGYDDWRLPTYSNGSGNGTTGEFYRLWVVELGNNADQQHPVWTYNPGPFHNVEYYINSGAYNPTAAYWTSYSYGDFAMAWMTFNAGYIGQYKEWTYYGVWVCRTGDSGWAPACTAPAISINPAPVTVCGNGQSSAFFSATASGTGPLSYRWRMNATPIDPALNPSAATATLTISFVGPSDSGSYDCIVSNTCGSTTSSAALLDVTPCACSVADIAGIGGLPPPDGLLTGDDFNAFIGAFAVGDALADIVGIGGLPPPDGLITGDDFNAFIAAFAGGCP